jgi:hypothetical protein
VTDMWGIIIVTTIFLTISFQGKILQLVLFTHTYRSHTIVVNMANISSDMQDRYTLLMLLKIKRKICEYDPL